MNFRLMKSARFLVVVVLSFMSMAACASATLHQQSSKALRFSGHIFDSVSRRPIAAVLVRLISESGCDYGGEALTDSLGHFVSQLNWRPRGAIYAAVKTTYYEGQVLIESDKSAEIVLLLHRNSFRFAPAACGPLADSNRVNPYASQCLFGNWPSKGFQSFYIANPGKQAAGYLRTITFDEARMGSICSQFRLRVFAVDAVTQEPRGNILTENVMLCLFRNPTRPPRLVTYDISSFEIPVPANGFYLSLEEVTSSDKFYPCPDELPNYSPTGMVLKAPCTYEQCQTWTWKNMVTTEGYWTPPAENCWPLYESAISVEVKPAPAKR
ncbi:hypothetical protein MON38_10480 [Hymenobacter sp. DH14]|uniref:Uncharacterized protein n=1 Tax=Hymenobacter cyanobacteriorum TaxID=2926463 RepID=A0A9X1VF93_9BACT|nr:hypothetical protein [Hymenobacter cyanobacteriorum]MCI1187846.1 hypothetical protein [Hymenobacter cyanobacteriorum]